MPNGLYDLGREGFATAAFSWTSTTIQLDIIDAASYTVNLTTHDFRDDVPAAARVTNFGGSVQTLGSKTATAGVLDAADASFTSLSSAPTFEALQIFADLGTDAQDRLIIWIDTATGLATPAGVSQINVTWDNGANKVAKI